MSSSYVSLDKNSTHLWLQLRPSGDKDSETPEIDASVEITLSAFLDLFTDGIVGPIGVLSSSLDSVSNEIAVESSMEKIVLVGNIFEVPCAPNIISCHTDIPYRNCNPSQINRMFYSNWSTQTKIAAVSGVVVALAGAAYLMSKQLKADPVSRGGKRKVDKITKEQVIQIIDEIAAAQNKMKGITQTAIGEVLSKDLNFEQTYDYCLKIQPTDPLQKYGLTTGDFDLLLDREQHDHRVRERLAKIMGIQENNDELANASGRTRKALEMKDLVSIHEFMLDELKEVSSEVDTKLKRGAGVDLRALAVAAQVLVGAKVQEKFSVDTDDIESSIIKNHDALAKDVKFAQVNEEIQRLMARFFDIQPM